MTNIMIHATKSSAYTYTLGSDEVQQLWFDGSGRTFRYPTNTKRGRYLVSLVARKGFLQTIKD